MAKQTGETVISISQEGMLLQYIRFYKIYLKTHQLFKQSYQAIELENKTVLDGAINNLSVLEFENIVTLNDVTFVIQRTEMVLGLLLN